MDSPECRTNVSAGRKKTRERTKKQRDRSTGLDRRCQTPIGAPPLVKTQPADERGGGFRQAKLNACWNLGWKERNYPYEVGNTERCPQKGKIERNCRSKKEKKSFDQAGHLQAKGKEGPNGDRLNRRREKKGSKKKGKKLLRKK